MRFDVITLFPAMVEQVAQNGVVGRSADNELFSLNCWNPRDYSEQKHRNVDDRPYGGGPGMVMAVQPLEKTLEAVKKDSPKTKVVYLSPQGKPLTQGLINQTAELSAITFICGRYEGVDQRFIDRYVDEEWSIGDYVLSGGELAAMVCIDAIVRQLPGALGSELSAKEDSFSDGLLDCPHYTRPESCLNESVPQVLLNGNHKEIKTWRLKQSLGQTWLRRPDLLEQRDLTDEQQNLLNDFISEHQVK